MIIPALDLFNGKIVRLYKGKYEKMKFYDQNIYNLINKYQIENINMLHIVDLNGALNPNMHQFSLLKTILQKSKIPIQIGGGIRKRADVEKLLLAGAKRIIIGSYAINKKNDLKCWFKDYGGSTIVLALDLKINHDNVKEIYVNAWKKPTGITLETLIKEYSEFGLKHVLCTDISKDGTLKGPNLNLYYEITKLFKHINFQSSGGIGKISDIAAIKKTNVKDVIIGKALLENRFSLQEAIKCWQNA